MRLSIISVVLLCLIACKDDKWEKEKPKQYISTFDPTNQKSKASRIDKIIESKINNGFNGAVLIASQGHILFEKYHGFENFEDSLLLKPSSRFQVASLSKTFTAVAVMQLVEKGKLSLDLTVKDYYPDFPYEGVTLRSLLSHRSGLPYYEYALDKYARESKTLPSNQDLMKWWLAITPTPPTRNLPDHFFSYNNTNFAILAALVEKVTDRSFEKYIHENIFENVKMDRSMLATEVTDSTHSKGITWGYEGRRRIQKHYLDNILGDKGVYSTPQDLYQWYRAIKEEKLLDKSSLREMYTPRSFEYPGLRNYGYGFRLWLNDKQQTDYIYHTGWWKGYNSIMFFDLREDFVIILLSNRYDRSVYYIKDIIDALHDGKKSTTVEENILDL